MRKLYLAPGHGLDSRTGKVDPGANDGTVNEQQEGDRAARDIERIILDRFVDLEVRRQPKGGPNFRGTRGEIDAYEPDLALELHHDWIRAPRGGFGFDGDGGVKREICDRLTDAYGNAGLRTRPHMTLLPGTSSQPGLYRADTEPVVLWEIDRIGEYTEDHAHAIAEGIGDYLDLEYLAFPEVPVVADPDPDAPGRGYLTVGDRGAEVVAWQRLLIDKGFAIPAGATGNFLEQTRRATLQAYAAVGLAAADRSRPRVGQRSWDALKDYQPAPWRGKRVVARVDLRFYRRPGWHPSNATAGILEAGWGFRGGIHDRRKVGNGYQYEVSNSSGDRYWLTASSRFVRLLDV